MKYDYLIVGSGLYGSVFAHELKKAGKNVLVIEKRKHIGGNIYTENIDGINVHKYGAHIFHTNDKKIWDYINKFSKFNSYINSPIANYKGEIYNLPFNMNTFTKLWRDVTTPAQAKVKIREQIVMSGVSNPTNLEEQAISLVGVDIYEKLIKGYTQKQWGRSCDQLPVFIIKRLPIRFTFNNNYFDDVYQGIPKNGYTEMIENLLDGITVMTNVDYLSKHNRHILNNKADKVVYTGCIDAYFNYCLGELEYRSLKFETENLSYDNYQGNAVVNYTDADTPYTRIIEHKWFTPDVVTNNTIISKEYPKEWSSEDEPYYPINDAKNNALYSKYLELAKKEKNVIFGGRLGSYLYYDMDDTIKAALSRVRKEVNKNELS